MVMNGTQYYTGSLKQFNIKNTYFIECNKPDLFSQYLTTRKVSNWYNKNANWLFFIIPSPLALYYVTNFAIQQKIIVNKISPADFSFNFLNQRIANNKK